LKLDFFNLVKENQTVSNLDRIYQVVEMFDTKIAQESSPGLTHSSLVQEWKIKLESRHKYVEVVENV
jgi:hypothetical protein